MLSQGSLFYFIFALLIFTIFFYFYCWYLVWTQLYNSKKRKSQDYIMGISLILKNSFKCLAEHRILYPQRKALRILTICLPIVFFILAILLRINWQ